MKSLIQQNPTGMYASAFWSRSKDIPLSTKLSMLNQAPLAAIGIGPKSWRAAQLAPRTVTKIPDGLAGAAAGFVVGQVLAPVLDYVSNEVYKDPTSGGHIWSTIGKHAVSGVASGATFGGMAGAAFGGVGAGPGAAIGALAGGLAGAVQGIFDSMSQVN